jgi:transcriptional regulator with XRE-family HTH domain
MALRPFPKALRARAKALLKSEREATGLSPEAVAAMVRVEPATIKDYERMGGTCPSRPLYADLAGALRSLPMINLMLEPLGMRAIWGDSDVASAIEKLERLRPLLRQACAYVCGGDEP